MLPFFSFNSKSGDIAACIGYVIAKSITYPINAYRLCTITVA